MERRPLTYISCAVPQTSAHSTATQLSSRACRLSRPALQIAGGKGKRSSRSTSVQFSHRVNFCAANRRCSRTWFCSTESSDTHAQSQELSRSDNGLGRNEEGSSSTTKIESSSAPEGSTVVPSEHGTLEPISSKEPTSTHETNGSLESSLPEKKEEPEKREEPDRKDDISEPLTPTRPSSPVPPGFNMGGPGVVIRLYDQMSPEDLERVRSIFTFDTYYVTETIPYQNGAIFRGNLRWKRDTEDLLKLLDDRLKALNLQESYRLFLLENFEDDRPVVVVAPTRNDPETTTPFQWVLAFGLAAFTSVTCFEAGAISKGFDIFATPELWQTALVPSVGIMTIQVAHEVAHRVASFIHKVRLSPPFFLPSDLVGTFGAVTNFEDHAPNRKALLDISLAGPGMALILSFAALLIGFATTTPDSATVPASYLQGSAFIGSVARFFFGDLALAPDATVKLSPLAIVGWSGLTVTALNLIPTGRLDGGRIVQALFGRKVAARVGGVSFFVLLLGSLFGGNLVTVYWTLAVLFLQRTPERPSINEYTPLDNTRTTLGLAALAIMILILCPLPTPQVTDPFAFP